VPITLKQLARGDQLTVTADDKGVARLVVAERRTVEGTVESLTQLTTTDMASLRVSGGGADHVIDLNAILHLADGDTTVRAQPLGMLKLAVGDRVRVRLNPTNGRVVELWKLL
jgi:antitoxin (DNA-binding transcriptional repressor) of toxin-antitoxin stability system